MSVTTLPMRGAGPDAVPQGPPVGLPRLLPPGGHVPEGLRDHLARHGALPYRGGCLRLIPDIEAAGLTGRGGASFPVHRKLAAVAGAGRRPFVVANGAESESASSKDVSLLWLAPHLVLDGIQLAAEAVGAAEACLYLHAGPDNHVAGALQRALAQRWNARIDRVAVHLAFAPPRFLAGQETALVNVLNGGLALPTYTPPRIFERGVGGAPTLVQNVETLAHIALIARYGAAWFRGVGTREEPGSMLCTVRHADGGPHIVEAAIGTPLSGLLHDDLRGDGTAQRTQAVLVGGYHGTWIPAARAAQLTLDNAALRNAGAALGAGIIAALPADRCGLAETARVASYLVLESAGQCGPCLNGLPRIAAALAELAGPRPGSRALANIERWAGLVSGRGACRHPDGATRFIGSALTVFAAEIGRHRRGVCSATTRAPFLPLPPGTATSDEDWS
ncbi:MAG TPA: NADH-ubiquinone oxidoreductase-F iron-sulfur binding region domain-containing protein [Streptosporangiaceae bacterium]|nr:NADH-ubiquinone oxidoreductase-F iron-sulfur binding region domain-containing protein [Streptosporangiaceae bacterium]